MALISQSELEAKLGRSLTTDEQNAFTTLNNAVQKEVESIIGSSVEEVSETSRYYDGGLQHLKIDPCTSISSVKLVDDDEDEVYTYLDKDITLEPRNSTIKQMLRRRSGVFVTGINNIKVTAKFSIYDDEDMRNVVKEAILDYLVQEIDENSNIKRETIEGYSVEYIRSSANEALSRIRFYFPEV